jgi:hypothetical protein
MYHNFIIRFDTILKKIDYNVSDQTPSFVTELNPVPVPCGIYLEMN